MFTALRIGRLPSITTPEPVLSILTQLGYTKPLSIDSFKIVIFQQNGQTSAEIETQDPYFASKVCSLVAEDEMTTLEAVSTTQFSASESVSCRIDCRTLSCSWKHAECRWSVVLCYGPNYDTALQVQELFKSGVYKVLGEKAICDAPSKCSYPLVPISTKPTEDERWVCLRGLPPSVLLEDIKHAILHEENRPQSAYLPQYALYESLSQILMQDDRFRLHLWNFGPIERTVDTEHVIASFRFDNDTDAKFAIEMLNSTANLDSISFNIITTASFDVDIFTYFVLKKRIEAEKIEWRRRAFA